MLCLSSSSVLGEVRGHILLEVEVSELLTLLKLEKLRKSTVSLNDTTIVLVLQLVVLNISMQSLGHLSASHLSTGLHTKEGSKLVRDESRLDKTRGGTVTRLHLVATTLRLGRNLNLTSSTGMVGAKVRLHLGQLSGETGEGGKNSRELLLKRSRAISNNVLRGSSLSNNLGSGGSGLGLLLNCLGRSSCLCSGLRSGGLRTLNRAGGHQILY